MESRKAKPGSRETQKSVTWLSLEDFYISSETYEHLTSILILAYKIFVDLISYLLLANV